MRTLTLLVLLSGSLFAQGPFVNAYDVAVYRGQPNTVDYFGCCGIAPYTYLITAGTLPTGMTLTTSTEFDTAGHARLSGTPTVNGDYPVTIRMNDSMSGFDEVSITIHVRDPLTIVQPPATLAWTEGRPFSFPIAATGGLGPPYEWFWDYEWEGDSPPFEGWGFTETTMTGTAEPAGTYSYRLRLGTYTESSVTRVITFTSNPAPDILTSFLGYPQTGSPQNFTISRSGGTAPFTWSVTFGSVPAGMTLNTSTGAVTGTPTVAGPFNFTVQVVDAAGASDVAEIYGTVVNPFVFTTAATLPPAQTGQFFLQTIGVSGGLPSYYFTSSGLPEGVTLDSQSGQLSGVLYTPNTYLFPITVWDGREASINRIFSLTVQPPMTISSNPVVQPSTVGRPTTRTFTVTGGATPITWSLFTGQEQFRGAKLSVRAARGPSAPGDLPAGMTLIPTGVLSGTPTTPGLYTFTLIAEDALGNVDFADFSMTINAAPQFTLAPPPIAFVGVSYSLPLSVSNGTSPFTWTATNLPSGFSINSGGLISGTGQLPQVRVITVKVTDAAGAFVERQGTLEVVGKPSISSGPPPPPTINAGYLHTFTMGGGKAPATFALKSGSFGPGLAMSPQGQLGGTPSAQGVFTFEVEVTDSLGQKASAAYTYESNFAPYIITGPALPGGTQGAAYALTIEAANGAPPYTFSRTGGTLPPGIALSPQGVLGGTPTATGSYAFTVTIEDAGGRSNTRAMLLLVAPPLTITTATPLPSATVGAVYLPKLEASGGTAPRTWAVTGGALPSGLSLTSAGTFAGSPTVSGSFSFTARVTDAQGTTASKVFTLVATEGFSATPTSFIFNGISGGPIPAFQNLSLVSTPPNGTVQLKSAVPWLSFVPTATTPAIVAIRADPKDLEAGVYETTILVEGPTVSPVNVKFIVAEAAPGQFSVDPSGINLSTTKDGSVVTSLITVTALSANTQYTASVQTDAGNWLAVSPSSGVLQPETPVSLLVTANPAGLDPGTYKGRVVLRAPASDQQTVVPVNLVVSPKDKSLYLSFNGFTFRAITDGPPPSPQEVLVLNAGNGSMAWTATSTVNNGPEGWLQISGASGTSTKDLPAPFSVSVNPAGLEPGEYYGRVDVIADGADGSPQAITVVLEVREESPGPEVIPSGLIFTAAPGGPNPPPQTVKVVNLTKTALTFVSSSATEVEPNWIDFTPKQGSLAASGSLEMTISATITDLPAGVRRGTITLQFSDGSIRVIDLALVLPASAAVSSLKSPAATGCAPSRLVPVFTTLGSGFTVSSGWPIPVQLKVVDDCGDPISQGSVTASFSTGDPALTMTALKPGDWSATWTPKKTQVDSLTITGASRNPPGTLLGSVKATGSLKPNTNPPVISASGVLSAASYALDAPVGVGSLVAIFGERFAENLIVAPTTPLPTTLGNTQVIVGGKLVPLQFVSGSQINVLVPYDTEFNTRQQFIVRRGAAITTPETVVVAPTQPGVFTTEGTGRGQGIVNDVNSAVVDPSNPTQAGEVITIYCTGLGEVSPHVPAGEVAPSDELALVVNPVTVTIGGVDAPTVLFAGLAPGQVGLYQVNVVVPEGVPTGDAVELVVTAAGQIGSAVTIAVKAP